MPRIFYFLLLVNLGIETPKIECSYERKQERVILICLKAKNNILLYHFSILQLQEIAIEYNKPNKESSLVLVPIILVNDEFFRNSIP